MPVAKRPRKSSSDLDQGSPSLTEEENSETSSESEKNSDQVRRFGAASAWRLGGWRRKGCGKSVTICGDSDAEAGGADWLHHRETVPYLISEFSFRISLPRRSQWPGLPGGCLQGAGRRR